MNLHTSLWCFLWVPLVLTHMFSAVEVLYTVFYACTFLVVMPSHALEIVHYFIWVTRIAYCTCGHIRDETSSPVLSKQVLCATEPSTGPIFCFCFYTQQYCVGDCWLCLTLSMRVLYSVLIVLGAYWGYTHLSSRRI